MTPSASPTGGATVLRAAWSYDGTGGTLTPDPVLVLVGGVIAAVGRLDGVPEGAAVVDLGGATLLPGLVDPHVHLAFDASPDPVGHLAARDAAAALAAMAAAARRAARGGVTTVRDLGDRDHLSLTLRGAAASDASLPTIVAAGPPITTPEGHCHYLGGGVSGVAAVRAAVRERAERGVDVIKIMASGGQLTPGTRPEVSQFTLEELRAAVEEAHRHGLPVTAHAHGARPVADALAAGVDGLEHVTFMTSDGVDRAPDDLVTAIAKRGAALGITLGVAPVEGSAVPPAVAARLPALMANARRLYEAGARIVAGTDAGIGPVKPPDVLRWAVGELPALGLSGAEALRAATSLAAEVCGLGDRKGRLAPGYDADVLAVDGNPLEDPTALHRIRAVYVRGHRLPGVGAGSPEPQR
ncbi:Xaa-Pro dipeptidase [[Actinomadura] parvosata subsp. kistnae]|uniref:Amidohydrolase n=1 Tax=[Actinomadura] parvosata subsp. kistnae TaxID=1909395 RepID=A0A1U9ZY02_9ACTN|nr:amidohydrolase family protein [Nonomuraea sp. ATCC 55076]AQZ62841.1 amidohydrolase [Nonomuraea sp. ATCC 55076]SPL98382.1 Xaa-Pro dipeptidase [Actinomadura parvosata subsp. kistnae]